MVIPDKYANKELLNTKILTKVLNSKISTEKVRRLLLDLRFLRIFQKRGEVRRVSITADIIKCLK